MNPYQYVILRYVHDLSAEEFVNIGIVLWSPVGPRLTARFNERFGRMSKFFADFDGLAYRTIVRHVEGRFQEEAQNLAQTHLLDAPPDGLLRAVHVVLPEDDTAFQWSPLRGGVADDLEMRADELFNELVLKHETRLGRERRDENLMKKDLDQFLRLVGLDSRLVRQVEVAGENYEYSFHRGWTNGELQVLEPISLDFVNTSEMVEKANTWSGRLYNLSKGASFKFTAVIAPPGDASQNALDRALSILRSSPQVRRVVLEKDLAEIAEEIQGDLDVD